jgi:hypothetical protein
MDRIGQLHTTTISSYGVRCELASNDPTLLKDCVNVAESSLLGNLCIRNYSKVHHRIILERTSASYYHMTKDGERLASGRSRVKFLKFFDSIIRGTIAESAPKHIFVHAGAVAWKGMGILMPADSFQGKSSLVSELVKAGADYYSDDFAVLDDDGMLHPFARPISMRTRDGSFTTFEIPVEQIFGSKPLGPVPIRMILFTKYKRSAKFKPREMTPGEGVLELIKYTLTFRSGPERALQVLNRSTEEAVFRIGSRADASHFAKTLLELLEKDQSMLGLRAL